MPRLNLFALVAAVVLSVLPASGFSRTWHVKVDGSGDVPTIQAAIDAASYDDSVLVGPGTYSWSNQGTGDPLYGMIKMLKDAPALTIVGEMGSSMTILDGESMGRIFYFMGYIPGTPGGLTLDGFTFTGGAPTQSAQPVGGAFTAHLSSPIVRNCVFIGNSADQGGAVWCGGEGGPVFENCRFIGNSARYGGAVFFINTPFTVTVSNCEFLENDATRGGALYGYNVPLVVHGCTVTRNNASAEGGAMTLNQCYPSFVYDTTFYQNEGLTGGAIALLSTTTLTVERTIIAWSENGGAVSVPPAAAMTFACSDLFANWGGDWTGPVAGQLGVGGNISTDPLFCGRMSLDFRLHADSPCAPGHHPDGTNCGVIGAFPVGCGGVPVEERSWGAIKSRYAD
jgi:hypothetical protein